MTRMFLHETGEIIGRTAFGQRAGGVEVWDEHFLVRTKNLVGFGHEMNATHHDDVGIGRRRLLRQGETVADEVGNVLQVAFGVIVREDDGVFLLTQPAYLLLQVDAFWHWLIDVAFGFPGFFDFCHSLVLYLQNCLMAAPQEFLTIGLLLQSYARSGKYPRKSAGF